jgi:hypothetical protein
MAAARGAVEIERLLAVFHLVEQCETDLHPVLVEVLDIVEVDQTAILALLFVSLGAMELVVARRSDAGASRDLERLVSESDESHALGICCRVNRHWVSMR